MYIKFQVIKKSRVGNDTFPPKESAKIIFKKIYVKKEPFFSVSMYKQQEKGYFVRVPNFSFKQVYVLLLSARFYTRHPS